LSYANYLSPALITVWWLVLEIPFLDNRRIVSAIAPFFGVVVCLVFVVRLNSLHGGLFPAVVYASFFTESLILAQDERWRRA
jgi:hypothetical protein